MGRPKEENYIDEKNVNQETCPNCGSDNPKTEDNGDRMFVARDGYAECSDCSIKWDVENDVVDTPLRDQ